MRWLLRWHDAFFSEMKGWRRLRGGHWEQLYSRPTMNRGWFRQAHGASDRYSWEFVDACEDYA